FGKLASHMAFVERSSRHLSRSIFHAMMRFQAKLERKQMVLFRIVDIGTDLFAMAAAISYATMLAKKGGAEKKNAIDLADVFCREARMRIDANFHNLFTDHDDAAYRLVTHLLKGEFDWFKGQVVEPVMPTPEQVEEAMAKLA
ncbi:MAG: acyl-CoA dehydrogenase, partial [Acidobacteria bacterium]|nr:acyl-CoA dehydrogenase [Acidobacteriota bacterium]